MTDVSRCLDDASPLPIAYFFTATLVVFLVLIRKGGLSVGQALLVLIGVRRHERKARSFIMSMAVVLPTLTLWLWLSAACRASLA